VTTVRNNVTGEAFRVSATIGEAFEGASGAFNIVQVPGNGNNIATQLEINLVVLQATQANIDAVRDRLLTLSTR
jgi:hypothetical protein